MLALERDRAEVIMESLRWLALLLSIVLLLQCIGSCLPSPLHRLERFAGNDLRAHFDVLVSMPSASANVALFAMFYEEVWCDSLGCVGRVCRSSCSFVGDRKESLSMLTRCARHGTAAPILDRATFSRIPVAHASGPSRGSVTLRCKLFFERVGQTRACWHGSRFQGDLSVLPRGVQRTVRQLWADVSWQLPNGVSGASTSLRCLGNRAKHVV